MPFNIKKSLKYQAFKMDFKAFLFLINILIYLDFTAFGHKKEIFELEVKHAKQINELNVKIENLEKENVKRETIEHGKLSGKYCITKYEIDTKTIVIVKEHKFYFNKRSEIKIPKEFVSDVHYGENFKTLCDIMVVEEVISLERIKEFVEILTGGLLKISEGSLVNWLKEKSRKCRNTIKKMKIRLKNTEILQTDLTETKVSNKKGYVRNYSNDKITVYIPSKDKKIHRVKKAVDIRWIYRIYSTRPWYSDI